MMHWIERQAARILSWAIARRLGIPRPLIDREVAAIGNTVVGGAEWFEREVDILSTRLTRRFDVGMAMNEATQRAMQARAELDYAPEPIGSAPMHGSCTAIVMVPGVGTGRCDTENNPVRAIRSAWSLAHLEAAERLRPPTER